MPEPPPSHPDAPPAPHPPAPPASPPPPDPRADVEALHARLAPAIHGWFAQRAGTHAGLADDLAQRTWAGLWQAVHAGRFDPARARLSTFLYAVMLNTWRQHAKSAASPRARRTRPAPDDLDQHPHQPDSDPATLAHAESIDAVRSALADPARAGLTPDQALLLRLIGDGATDRDLAARLNIAPSTAHARRRAALAALRAHLAAHPSARTPPANQSAQHAPARPTRQ